MSIVIPAGHLERTVITVRYDAPHTAPHIECAALDEQHSYAQSPRLSHTFSSDARPTPSSSTAPPSPKFTSNAQAALNVERGVDHRGHFVRLSFQQPSPPCSSHVFGQRAFDHDVAETSYFPLSNTQARSPTGLGFAQEASSFHTPGIGSPQAMNGGSSLEYSSMPITNNIPTAPGEANPTCLDSMDFGCPSDSDLMTALGSFMGIFDMPHNAEYPMLNMDVSGNMPSSQSINQISDPASPEMSSASSSSSCTNSPTTPYDFFLPASTPTVDGGCRGSVGGAVGGSFIPTISDSSLQSSPILPQLTPGPKPKVGASSKTGDSRLLPCPQPGCKRQFKSTSTLGGHMKTHAGKGARFPCSFPPCAEKFSRRHDQLRHEVYKHGKRCEWVCARCNSFFSYERSLDKHVCTMDKSRRGSIPYPTTGVSNVGSVSGATR